MTAPTRRQEWEQLKAAARRRPGLPPRRIDPDLARTREMIAEFRSCRMRAR